MGKTIISLRFLKDNFLNVAFAHADGLCDEFNLDKNIVAKELNDTENMKEFIETYDKYFGEEIEIRL